MLSGLGASQGQTTTIARTYFYRANATRPLIELVHSTPSHSSSASKLYIHALDLEEATSVPALQPAGDIHIYPNPITPGGKIQIALPVDAADGWQYTITNTTGRIVAQGVLVPKMSTGLATLRMPKDVAAGAYYLSLQNNGKQRSAFALIVR